MSLAAPTLGLDNTHAVSQVRHRLAMGVQWIDAVGARPALGGWASELRAVGLRPLVQALDVHPLARHALRHAGRLAKVLARAAQDRLDDPPATPADDPTRLELRAWGHAGAPGSGYLPGEDPRLLVPRRLALLPVLTGGLPAPGLANLRSAWLWPGARYPLPAGASALRGRVRRGADLAHATPVPWCRLLVTRPGAAPPNPATEAALGWGHGDDRGEFLVVLGPEAAGGGAALPTALSLRLWVFLPPAAPFDPAQPLQSLPLEVAEADELDVLQGQRVPAGFVQRGPIDLSPGPGRVLVLDDAQLLFA